MQAGENMLLQFRDVRNELGAGNDIFNRASGWRSTCRSPPAAT